MNILSRSGWTATSDNDLGSGFEPSKSIDSNDSTFFHSNSGYPHWLKMDMGSAQSFDTLVFTPRQSATLRVPLTWSIEVSSDNSSWTVVASGSWSDNTALKYVDLGSQNIRYIRLNGLTGADGYMACAEFNLWSHDGPEFAPHNLTSNASNPPIVTAASSLSVGYRAFDGSFDYNSHAAAGNTGNAYTFSIDFGPGGSALLKDYDFCCHNLIHTRAPKDWTVQGSSDGSSWTTIDTVTGQTSWAPSTDYYNGSFERRAFSCDTQTTAYRYLRFVITDNNGDSTNTQVEEVFLYGTYTPAPAGGIPVIVYHLRQQGIL